MRLDDGQRIWNEWNVLSIDELNFYDNFTTRDEVIYMHDTTLDPTCFRTTIHVTIMRVCSVSPLRIVLAFRHTHLHHQIPFFRAYLVFFILLTASTA
jgi:hypothetical protein